MSNNWVTVLYSCNKLLPVVWDIFDSDQKLNEFVSESNIIEIYNSELQHYSDSDSASNADSKSNSINDYCYSNCALSIPATHKIFKINDDSYNYFTSKVNEFFYKDHFDRTHHAICEAFIIAVKKEDYKICEIIENLKIY